MDRALGLWHGSSEEFQKLAIQGMNADYSWRNPAKDYLEIYDYIRHKP